MSQNTETAAHDSGDDEERNDLLFSGLSFWISAKVPQRARFIDQIKKNGGKVVSVEKDAAICLVDDMKNDIYRTEVTSYKFVEQCIREKSLLDPNDFEVPRKSKLFAKGKSKANIDRSSNGASEPVTALRKYKSGRTPFTLEDDRILLETISKEGVHPNGNKIYQILEGKYPHHTWQSWRSRWVDQLSKRMPNGPAPLEASEGSEEETPKEPTFTRQDDAILISMKDEIVKAQNEKVIYQKIQRKYPHHSDILWRYRFNNVILPLLNKKEVMKTSADEELEEDVSPELSEEEPIEEEVLQAGFENAARLDEKVGGGSKLSKSSTPTPKPRTFKKSHSLPDPLVQPVVARHGARRFSDAAQGKFLTPAHHHTSTTPPDSPKGHPTLPISPARPHRQSRERSEEVQRWRAEVSIYSSQEVGDNEPTISAGDSSEGQSPISSSLKRKRSVDQTPQGPLVASPKRQRRSRSTSGTDDSREIPSPRRSEAKWVQRSPTLSNPAATVGSPPSTRAEIQNHTEEYYDDIEGEDDQQVLSDNLQLRYDSSLSRGNTPDKMDNEDEEEEEDVYTEQEYAAGAKRAHKDQKGKVQNIAFNGNQQKSLDVHNGIEKQHEFQQVRAYVILKAEEYNLDETTVVEAIVRTSGIEKLVDLVLQEFSEGQGLPDMRGVWTEKDDQYLTSGNEELLHHVEMKHGNLQEREDFLSMWNSQ